MLVPRTAEADLCHAESRLPRGRGGAPAHRRALRQRGGDPRLRPRRAARQARSKPGYVLLQGLSNPNRSMLLRRLVVARKGMAAGPRAVEAVMRFCFEEMRFHRLWLDVREDNAPARRSYERFGFFTEG